MCESTKLAQSHRFGIKLAKNSSRLTGWVGTVASVAAIVFNSGCCMDFGRRCRCCCQTSCQRPIQVSDQYKAFQNAAVQNGTSSHGPAMTTPKPVARPQVNYENVKFNTPPPKPSPIVPIDTDKSTAATESDGSIWSNVKPETIDDMVDDLFERSRRKASGLAELPVGEIIETGSPLTGVVEELELEETDTIVPAITEPFEVEPLEVNPLQPELSMVADEPVAVIAQLPADSVSQPFRIMRLPQTENNRNTGLERDVRNSDNDRSVFELNRILKLQAVPVDKQNQRLNGVQVSSEAIPNSVSSLSFLPEFDSSLFVIPAAGPRALDPSVQLEAVGARSIRSLPRVEGDSMESQSTLPPILKVIR